MQLFQMVTLFLPLIILYQIISSSSSVSSPLHQTLHKGSSLSVERPDNFLISPNRVFTAGFYQVGDNAFCFAICFNSTKLQIPVWMANRDFPVNGKRSKLSLLKTGNLILTDVDHVVWDTKTISKTSYSLQLLDNGNLVLITGDGVILWQSFDFPTDTLLPSQPFRRNTMLVSSRSHANFSSGFYKLLFDDNNVLRLQYDGIEVSSIYWPDYNKVPIQEGRSAFNSSRIASLDLLGRFTSSDRFKFSSADYGERLQRRLSLDSDGNLRLYSWKEESWIVTWEAFAQTCMIHGICGPNSLCSYDPSFGRKCSCLPGFKVKSQSDWSLGCESEFKIPCVESEVAFIRLPHTDSSGFDFGYEVNWTFDRCKNFCMKSCACKGFEFQGHTGIPNCYPKMQLFNGQSSPNFEGDLYLKVPSSSRFSSNLTMKSQMNFSSICPVPVLHQLDRIYVKTNENWSLRFLLWFSGLAGMMEISAILVWLIMIRTKRNKEESDQAHLHAATGFKRYTYDELKKATRNFNQEIGRGAGGIVYKGTLSDQRIAAIKLLNRAEQGEAQFLAELSTIGKLNHMNLIKMWGYCVEGKQRRLLVYEFMENGSLAKNLSSNKALGWKKRFKIALGTAKGLAYLHDECLEWVVHCDIKPENILLDSDYQPKISDFGLSRLLARGDLRNAAFSRIRGTRGYMAPEWLFNLQITAKVDVYSYGIVLLEMVTGKCPIMGADDSMISQNYNVQRVVEWVKKKTGEADHNKNWVKEILDPAIRSSNCDMKKLESLIVVGLQCVEENKDARPTMKQVVEMLLRCQHVQH